MTHKFTHVAHTHAEPTQVTAILDDAPGWSNWARPVLMQSAWERWGDPAPGGVGAVRRVGLWPVFIREQVTEWDPGARQRYTVLSPHLFNSYDGEVVVNTRSDGSTRIQWTVEFTPRLRGSGRLLRAAFSFTIAQLVSRLARAAESAQTDPQHTK